jgi:hypothetical protein
VFGAQVLLAAQMVDYIIESTRRQSTEPPL